MARAIAIGLRVTMILAYEDSVGSTSIPTTLALVHEMGQTGVIGLSLPRAPVVRVTDNSGNPVKGIPVTWRTETGEGTLVPSVSTSNEAGDASTSWTFGSIAGSQRVSATVDGLTPVFLEATATPGQIAALSIRGSTDTLGAIGDTLRLETLASDRFGNPVSGSFAWASTNPNVVEVDNSGLARARDKGSAQISATLTGMAARKDVHVTATAVAADVGSGGGAVTHPCGAQITVPAGDSVSVRIECACLGELCGSSSHPSATTDSPQVWCSSS